VREAVEQANELGAEATALRDQARQLARQSARKQLDDEVVSLALEMMQLDGTLGSWDGSDPSVESLDASVAHVEQRLDVLERRIHQFVGRPAASTS
jgi:hypothetical protein